MSELIFTGMGNANFDRLIQMRAKKFNDMSDAQRVTDTSGTPIRKIYDRVYTTNLRDDPATIVRRNPWQILGHLFPGAVISGRSAMEMAVSRNKADPSAPGFVFLTSSYRRNVSLPGLEVRIAEGPGRLPGDTEIMGLILPSPARQVLENLASSRARSGVARTLGPGRVEQYLVKQSEVSGEAALNQIRDHARDIKEALNAESEFELLNKMIGSLLGTRKDSRLTTDLAIAYAAGEPFDSGCVDRLNVLFSFLNSNPMPNRPDLARGRPAATNTAFMEAYFSNYIEGTTFLLDEARDIVFEGKIPENRPKDGHDVLATFAQLADYENMRSVGKDFDAFIAGFKARHALLMKPREDVHPGSFKTSKNRAGNTVFVNPEHVVGTFRRGFEMMQGLRDPFARAAFIHFMVSDIHPFDDGNGRMARIMMANELTAGGQTRIVIPTVFRDDYLGGQRSMTSFSDPEPTYRMLMRTQAVVANIVEDDFDTCTKKWASTHAFVAPGINAQLTEPSDAVEVQSKDGILAPASYWEAESTPRSTFGL